MSSPRGGRAASSSPPARTGAAWAAWRDLEALVATGAPVVIDGGTGTEVAKRREGLMDAKGWSCAAHLHAPQVVRDVHMSFFRSGAQLVIANSYACNRNVMAAAGLGDRTVEALTSAVSLACEARDTVVAEEGGRRRLWVAASLSTHPPAMAAGGGTSDTAAWPDEEEEVEAYAEAASTLAGTGADFLFLEMMKDREHAPRAIRAAAACGMPVFLGISSRWTCEAAADLGDVEDGGDLVLFGSGSGSPTRPVPLTPAVLRRMLAAAGPNLVGVNVMHTKENACLATAAVVRDAGWTGLLGVYPDRGRFTMPHWQHAPLEPGEAEAFVTSLLSSPTRVRLVGGCCGLGPDFVAAAAGVASEFAAGGG